MPTKDVEIWIAAYDIHFPQYHKPTFNALLDFLRRNRVDGFLFGGDQLDNACISHHNKGKGLYKLPGQYRKETEGFNNEILKPIERLLGKGVTKVWLPGNHGYWEHELVETNPELEGSVEREQLLGLEARGWKVVPFGKSYRYGELTFIHGNELGGVGNQNSAQHAKKAVEMYCTNVLYGHYHSPQLYTKILPTDSRRKWQAHCSPILGDVNPLYLENRATAWLNGFCVIEVRKNGEFNIYPIIVIDGVFSFAGKIYGGKK